ncbi:hypothetical protein [Pedobacter roseus]|uniref:Uncharacterized protein n=1 Tax=Pedobacter roseus TaxID=336820 RepID=A0A7G9QG60_9SPHI|nr:hypothetical protein [Pedobacter roseus]QNN42335.1 hypothetical protein H9L23_25185 [Pedobacter roseus]
MCRQTNFPTPALSGSGSFEVDGRRVLRLKGITLTFLPSPFNLKMGIFSANDLKAPLKFYFVAQYRA